MLRGTAVLGILLVNVRGFAMVPAAYWNPTANDSLGGAGFLVWAAVHLLADTKFISIFSVLFGAGMAMMADRAAQRGISGASLHYRRQLWLLAFGLAHAYLIWAGDILVSYALCGCLLYPLRNLRPRRGIVLGACVVAVVFPIWLGIAALIPALSGEELAAMKADWAPPAEVMDAQIAAFRGSWLEQMPLRSMGALEFQTTAFMGYALWRAGGLMLVGMALYRLGVLAASRSTAFYKRMAVTGLAVGLPVVAAGMLYNIRADFAWDRSMYQGALFNYAGSLGVFLGYVGLVMLAVKAKRLPGLQARLAATGRMALTNYIAQSVLCTLVFYGHGLGLFERVGALGQMGIVLAVWAAQLAWSPWWLRRFRFGPLEWLWRSLVYMKRQPMRAA